MDKVLEKRPWWNYVHEDVRELLKQSILLVKIFEAQKTNFRFHDYSFVVFPAAKAFEGFLKTLFHDLGFIDDQEFFGRRFRVGKALNPELEQGIREKEGVYDKLTEFCKGTYLPELLWRTWKEGRNVLFHWFPNEKNAISFEEAKERLGKILDAMDSAFKYCKLSKSF